jgi:hypothetical protein
MKLFALLMIFSLVIVSMLHGQEGQLVLTNKKTHIERALQPGKKIKVYTSENYFEKGRFSVIDSSSIAIGKVTIPLSDIVNVQAVTWDSRPSGIILTALGGLILIGTTDILIGPTDDKAYGAAALLFIIDAGITYAGINKLVAGKNYRTKHWDYTIRNSGVSIQ